MKMIAVALCLCTAAIPAQLLRLPDGTDLEVTHVPSAKVQATFTIFPHGLLFDLKDQPQWSHLVEHMLLRSTHPKGLGSAGITINGETMSNHVRLETLAEPKKWREALALHMAWRKPGELDPKTLAREKKAIAQEERFTVANRATHKWALAAWRQALRFEKKHVAVHGAVASAEADAVTLACKRLVLSNAVTVTIGPVPRKEIVSHVQKMPRDTKSKLRISSALSWGSNHKRRAHVTWDLPARHLVIAYPCTSNTLHGRLRAWVMSQVFMLEMLRDRELVKAKVRAAASYESAALHRGAVLVSLSIPLDADSERIELRTRKAVQRAMQGNRAVETMRFIVNNGRTTLGTSIEDQLAKLRGPRPQFAAAQLALNRIVLNRTIGGKKQQALKAMGELEAAQVLVRARKEFKDKAPLVLHLAPAR